MLDVLYIGSHSSEFSRLRWTLNLAADDSTGKNLRWHDLGCWNALGGGGDASESTKVLMAYLQERGWKRDAPSAWYGGRDHPQLSAALPNPPPYPTLILDYQEFAHKSSEELRAFIQALKRHDFLVLLAFPHASEHYLDLCLSCGADDWILLGESGVSLLWKIRRASERCVMQESLLRAHGSVEHFRHLSMYDELTGLYNMRLFRQRLREDFTLHSRIKRGLALLMFDVDYFKRVNDELSHLAGSQVLAQIGQVLKRHLREHDIAARFGGDEFVVILNQTKPEGTPVVALRLMEAVAREAFRWEKRRVRISLSCGVAAYDPTAHPKQLIQGSEDLLKQADQRLYHAKEQGRGCMYSGSSVVRLVDDYGQPFPLTHVL